jgi:hypothetical protein
MQDMPPTPQERRNERLSRPVTRVVLATIAVGCGVWMAKSMADEFTEPSTLKFFLGLVAGTAMAVVVVVQVQRLNPLANFFGAGLVERAASPTFYFGGFIFLAAAVGAFLVWMTSPVPNWSWQLFAAFGLGQLAGAFVNGWLDRHADS